MRILVNAVQRSSSKMLTINLSSYLKHSCNHTEVPILENWFELGQNRVGNTNHCHMTVENDMIKMCPLETSYADEIEHRLNFLHTYTNPLVIKIHPDNDDCHRASELLSQTFTCYNLTRRDIVEQTFSWVVTNLTREYVPGQIQEKHIADISTDPIIVTGHEFQKILQYIDKQNTRVKQLPAQKQLYLEDLVSIHTAREFCDYLELPFVDFELQTSSGIEYGAEKRRMIANFDELQKFGRYLVNKYNISH